MITYTHKNTHTYTCRAYHWYQLCCQISQRCILIMNPSLDWAMHMHSQRKKTINTLPLSLIYSCCCLLFLLSSCWATQAIFSTMQMASLSMNFDQDMLPENDLFFIHCFICIPLMENGNTPTQKNLHCFLPKGQVLQLRWHHIHSG